jgi:hypothetical protein
MSHYTVFAINYSGNMEDLDSIMENYNEEKYFMFADQFPEKENPYQPKWDWFVLDEAGLKLKNGSSSSLATVSQIKWKNDLSEAEIQEATEFWTDYVMNENTESEKYRMLFWNPKFYKDFYGTLETYLKCLSCNTAHAILDCETGKWYEASEVGWFGMAINHSEETDGEFIANQYDRFIKDLPENSLVAALDCHI